MTSAVVEAAIRRALYRNGASVQVVRRRLIHGTTVDEIY